jgi:hypothetical protein
MRRTLLPLTEQSAQKDNKCVQRLLCMHHSGGPEFCRCVLAIATKPAAAKSSLCFAKP